MKYKRIVITRHGDPEVLHVVEEDVPELHGVSFC